MTTINVRDRVPTIGSSALSVPPEVRAKAVAEAALAEPGLQVIFVPGTDQITPLEVLHHETVRALGRPPITLPYAASWNMPASIEDGECVLRQALEEIHAAGRSGDVHVLGFSQGAIVADHVVHQLPEAVKPAKLGLIGFGALRLSADDIHDGVELLVYNNPGDWTSTPTKATSVQRMIRAIDPEVPILRRIFNGLKVAICEPKLAVRLLWNFIRAAPVVKNFARDRHNYECATEVMQWVTKAR